jgi:hypothetical protein
LDDKSSPRAYPRDEIAAQARCAERLNHVGFWQASHRLSEVREHVNYEMPAEEARSLYNYKIKYCFQNVSIVFKMFRNLFRSLSEALQIAKCFE